MVCKEDEILLGMKKRGFGEGLWNGFGGKVEEGETILEAAKRELEEEVGMVSQELLLLGILVFTFANEPKELEVHVFKTTVFTGEPIESEEMKPCWFLYDNIPFFDMWVSDAVWFPALLEGKQFSGRFHFDAPSTLTHRAQILSQEFEVGNAIGRDTFGGMIAT